MGVNGQGPGPGPGAGGHGPIEVHIDELVLRGFPPGDHRAVAVAVEAELARLLTGGPTVDRRSAATRVQTGEVELTAGATAAAIGEAVARALHQTLTAPTPRGER